MSDYSKTIKYTKVDDLPSAMASSLSKPFSPTRIHDTLPFLKGMEVGETFKVGIPADSFGYSITEESESKSKHERYASLKGAVARTLTLFSKQDNLHYVFRIRENDLYIKRVEN